MIKKMYGKKETYGMWDKLYHMSLKGMNINLSGDIYSSGEIEVLKLLKNEREQNKILFDVGANVGKYAKALEEYFPNAQIYCFEPAQETFRVLKENVGGHKNIILNNLGIDSKAGEKELHYDRETSGLASLYDRKLDYFGIDFTKSEIVKVETLDGYCEKNRIDTIDFLKMDIEGNELNALEGASRLLAEKRINAIQMEFGGCNIDSRTYFRDFWYLLHENYHVYRILKNGLWEITRYSEQLECFCNTNYFFTKKENKGNINDA